MFFSPQPKAVRQAQAPTPEEVVEAPPQQTSEPLPAEDRAAQEAEARKGLEAEAQQTAELVAQELDALRELVGEAGAAQLKAFMQNAAAFELEQNR